MGEGAEEGVEGLQIDVSLMPDTRHPRRKARREDWVGRLSDYSADLRVLLRPVGRLWAQVAHWQYWASSGTAAVLRQWSGALLDSLNTSSCEDRAAGGCQPARLLATGFLEGNSGWYNSIATHLFSILLFSLSYVVEAPDNKKCWVLFVFIWLNIYNILSLWAHCRVILHYSTQPKKGNLMEAVF